jgi:hypothetical protein
VEALLRALERFAGLRELIELAYADQSRVVHLLTPPEERTGADAPDEVLPTQERTQRLRTAAANNRERLERLEALMADALHQAETQALNQADASDSGDDGQTDVEALRRRFERAEHLRRQALLDLERLSEGLDAAAAPEAAARLREPAERALADIGQLRRLFFNLVEHVQELLRDQADTHDLTATFDYDGAMASGLGPAARRQRDHAAVGNALAEAAARQADAAGSAEGPQANAAVVSLTEAAGEIRAAAGRMDDAAASVSEAAGACANGVCSDLEPALEHQIAAMEHLENALRLLQPPPQEQLENQQAQQLQPQQQDEDMSQRQALRRLQAIREREAERQRRRQHAGPPEPVEKDW